MREVCAAFIKEIFVRGKESCGMKLDKSMFLRFRTDRIMQIG